jgi:pimeloyl-ACP methyl ester carboxylesterase
MAVCEAPGLKIRYREWGADHTGDPIVLVHGAAAGSATFLDLGRRLGARHRTIALDLPGHGQSPKVSQPISIEAYRDLVGWLCAQLGLSHAILVGHSMGGAIALEAALAWPEKVGGVVMFGAGAQLPGGPPDDYTRLDDLFAKMCYAAATPRELAERWARVSVVAPPDVARADFEACARWDARDRVMTLRVPLLVVCGDEDLMVAPRHPVWLAEHAPGAQLLRLPNAGHNLHHEHPDTVVQAVLDFAS